MQSTPKTTPSAPAVGYSSKSFEKLRARHTRRTFDEWVSIFFVTLFLVALLFCACGLIFFRAKNISVEGCTVYDAEQVLAECGITDRDNLFFIDEEELDRHLTLRFPYIERVTIKRVLPTTLILQIEEDKPAYLTEIHGDCFLLSESLRVLRQGRTMEEAGDGIDGLCRITLPTVTYAVVGRELGFVRDSTYSYMLDFLAVLHSSRYADQIDEVVAQSKFRISVYLGGRRYKVVFGSAEDAEEKLTFFTNILEQKFPPEAYAIVDVSDVDRAFVSIRDGIIEE